ncbi:MAG: hypothetical protein HXY34_01910 [Candidatus Thorarchaeota archaeon]|nr:hypothetical protein [Candidatus Thorarchaeota archaeon]
MPPKNKWVLIIAWIISIGLALATAVRFFEIPLLSGYTLGHVILYEVLVILTMSGIVLLIYRRGLPDT